MNKKILHFVSDDCVFIKLNDCNLGTIEHETDTLSCEIDNEENLMIFVFPINCCDKQISIPFSAKINICENEIFSSSNYIEITNFCNNHFEIKILSIQALQNHKQKLICKGKINNEIEVFVFDDGTNFLEINTKSKVFHYKLSQKIFDIKCKYFTENQNEFLYIIGKTTKKQDFLLIFVNYFCNLEIFADLIEYSKDEIKALTYQCDIAKHGIVQKYKLKDNHFELVDEYIVYLDSEPHKTVDSKIIPWAFCEAININDTKLARSYLDSNLNLALTDEHLLTFFGDYEEIKWNKYSNQADTLCFVYNNSNTVKTFKFEIVNNKISNIILLD